MEAVNENAEVAPEDNRVQLDISQDDIIKSLNAHNENLNRLIIGKEAELNAVRRFAEKLIAENKELKSKPSKGRKNGKAHNGS